MLWRMQYSILCSRKKKKEQEKESYLWNWSQTLFFCITFFFSDHFKSHYCPSQGRIGSHLPEDTISTQFSLKPNWGKYSPSKKSFCFCVSFLPLTAYFPYLQAIIRSCIKSVWRELIWAPFICFVSFVHTYSQSRGRGVFWDILVLLLATL